MRKRRKNKSKRSRIPGVWVGEVVDTSMGPKKKICFRIKGKWYFRMASGL